jgi:hypothetical protein
MFVTAMCRYDLNNSLKKEADSFAEFILGSNSD